MADSIRDPPAENTDFQELEDGEDLLLESAAAREVRGRVGCRAGGGGALLQVDRGVRRSCGLQSS